MMILPHTNPSRREWAFEAGSLLIQWFNKSTTAISELFNVALPAGIAECGASFFYQKELNFIVFPE
jgi:hypothetical protein